MSWRFIKGYVAVGRRGGGVEEWYKDHNTYQIKRET